MSASTSWQQHLSVQLLSGEEVHLANPDGCGGGGGSTTVAELRGKVAQTLCTPCSRIQLIAEGGLLQDDALLSALKNDIVITAVKQRPPWALVGNGAGELLLWDLCEMRCEVRLSDRGAAKFTAVRADFALHLAITGNAEGVIQIWGMQGDCGCLASRPGHTGWINALQADFQLHRAVAGGDDGCVTLWEWGGDFKLVLLWRQTPHREPLQDVSVAWDSGLLITASDEPCLQVWTLFQQKPSGLLYGHQDVVKVVESCVELGQALSASSDGSLMLWDLNAMACIRVLRPDANPGPVICMATSFEEGRALSTEGVDRLHLWDLGSGSLLATLMCPVSSLDADTALAHAVAGHRGELSLIDVGVDGMRLRSPPHHCSRARGTLVLSADFASGLL